MISIGCHLKLKKNVISNRRRLYEIEQLSYEFVLLFFIFLEKIAVTSNFEQGVILKHVVSDTLSRS